MKLLSLDSVDSTNAEALRRIADGRWRHQQGVLGILAQAQSGGRGRRGNQWHSAPGNLYFSLICRPTRPMDQWANLSLVVGLCLAEIAEQIGGIKSQLKWPNDVLVDGAKLAGILLEIGHCPDGEPSLVVGIGINLAHAPDIPGKTTTSLAALAAADTDLKPETWASAFSRLFAEHLETWSAQGFAPFREQWLARAVGMDQTLNVRLPNSQFSATMRGLGSDGALLVETADGKMRHVTSGEVFFGEPV